MGDNSWNGREQNHALVNVGGGRFEEVGTPWGLDDTRDARGLAAADFDRDGDVDFVVNNYRAEASYFLNDLASERGFVAVRLEGVRCARDAIGAEVAVVVGGRRQVKLLSAGSGYAGQTSKELLFGLGGAAAAESIEVRWPGGVVERFGGAPSGSRLRLVEGEGERVEPVLRPVALDAWSVGWWAWAVGLLGLAVGRLGGRRGR